MPLYLAPCGQQMTIVRIAAADKTKKHLYNLGLVAGEKVTVLSACGGSVTCIVKEGRLALDRGVAGHIFVA